MFDPITIVVAAATGAAAYHYIGRPLASLDSAAPATAFLVGAFAGGIAAYYLLPIAAIIGLGFLAHQTRHAWLPAAKDILHNVAYRQGWDLQKFERRDRLRRLMRHRAEFDATMHEIETGHMDPHYREQIIEGERQRYTKEMADMLGMGDTELGGGNRSGAEPQDNTPPELTDEERQEGLDAITREVRQETQSMGYSEDVVEQEIQNRYDHWLNQHGQ